MSPANTGSDKTTAAFSELIDQSVKAAQASWGFNDGALAAWSKAAQAYQADAVSFTKNLLSYSTERATAAAEYTKEAAQRDPMDTAGHQGGVTKVASKLSALDKGIFEEVSHASNEHFARQSSTIKALTTPVDAIIGAQQDLAAQSVEFSKSILESYYDALAAGFKDISAYASNPQLSYAAAKKTAK